MLSAALAQKGRAPLGLLWTCTSSIPIWNCAGLIKLQHHQQLMGAGWNKTASSSSELLTATLELGSAPETCSECKSSAPGSEMLLPSHPAVGHSPGDALGGTRRVTGSGSHELIQSIFFTPNDFTSCSNSSPSKSFFTSCTFSE